MRPPKRDDLVDVLSARIQRDPGLHREKAGQFSGPIADNWNTQGFQALPSPRKIQYGLRAGADHDHRRARQFGQIGRFVKGRIAMYAAYAAGREDLDPGLTCKGKRSGNGRRAIELSCDRAGEISSGHLPHTVASQETLELLWFKPNGRGSSDDTGDGRPRAGALDGRRHADGGFAVLRNRQPLGENGAFERNNRSVVGKPTRDVGKNTEHAGNLMSTRVLAASRAGQYLRDLMTSLFAGALAEHYRLGRELGAGGMATVYLARDLKHDRDVAVKVLRDDLAASVGADRFLAEIKTTARLAHPHILPLHDSGESAGYLYYVMPFIDGETLRARMEREGQMPLADALAIASAMADALGYAHSQGVIHRDVKPENIFLSGGHALVADFGIARAVSATNTRITSAGLALGTPLYMSPEQAAGDADVDGRADQYALASVLFEMLAGEPPFRGPSTEAILAQRFTRDAPSVSSKRPGLPRSVESAIARGLTRDPDKRFDTLRDFATALFSTPSESHDLRSIAVLPFANMSGDSANEYFSDGVTEEIINALTHL